MIPLKTAVEVKKMAEAGKVAALVLKKLKDAAKEGVNTYDLDQLGFKYMKELGAISACYQYQHGGLFFPSYTCLSLNNEVVHGIGNKNRILKEGDILSIDVSIFYEGYAADNAATIPIGKISEEAACLLKATEEALFLGIEKAIIKNRVGDISFAIQKSVESQGFSVVKDFVGHGIGQSLHEEPQIPNFIKSYHDIRKTPLLKEGMTLAIEPMVNLGASAVFYGEDGWTILTKDNSLSAHFEHTVLITNNKPQILTLI